MAATESKASQIAAKALGINLKYRDDESDNLSRGESILSVSGATVYIEEEPTAWEWIRSILPGHGSVQRYVKGLFPFLSWIMHYNTIWLTGDLIAGITVGAIVVPQGMAYALLAQLPAEYGLYTSFMGFLLYWAFATSKDITIGTVAVMSTIVGNIVLKVQDEHPDIPAEEIARTLSLVAGMIVLFIGLTRIGWIVEWIPLTAITAFMTGSAISIAVGQVPALLGISGIKTREAAYKVVINTLKALPRTKIDAAMGLSALFLLYLIRYVFSFLTVKFPNRKRLFFFLSTLRIAFVILLYILISWLVNRNVKVASKAKFKILGPIPRGFQHAGAPKLNGRTISAFASELPATIIVLLIEHIAISKSFGRINNYTINPSQELVAIGFTNVFGPFLGAYPATGSFSRTAIKSKAGVRTPLAGVFTAIVVLLALYALTSLFFFIPMSSMAAVIIHAVGDLITPPNVVYQFWEVSPLEVLIFFAGVFVTIFDNIEDGIYVTIAASGAVVLYRLSRANGRFLGRVTVNSVKTDRSVDEKYTETAGLDSIVAESSPLEPTGSSRDIFIPLNHEDGSNPLIPIQTVAPGVFIYRFDEGFNYPNASKYMDIFTTHIFEATRRTSLDTYGKLGDRPWNDPGPRRGAAISPDDNRPVLKAIILDFSAVNNVDVSSVQTLVDVRNQLDRHAAPDKVDWHLAAISNRWTRRAFAAAGFGYQKSSVLRSSWKPIFATAETEISNSGSDQPVKSDLEHQITPTTKDDGIQQSALEVDSSSIGKGGKGGPALLYGANRPFFHVDVASAVEAVYANLS